MTIKPTSPPPDRRAFPMTLGELRKAWRAYPDPAVRDLILEIRRLHHTLGRVDGFRQSFERSWKEVGGGTLFGLHELRVLLSQEPGVAESSLVNPKRVAADEAVEPPAPWD